MTEPGEAEEYVVPVAAGFTTIGRNPECGPVDPQELARLSVRMTDCGGCWVNIGKDGRAERTPKAWSRGTVMALRRALWVARYGAAPATHDVVAVCGRGECCRPEHCRSLSYGKQGRLAAAMGINRKSLLQRAQMARRARERSNLSAEAVADIRHGGGTLAHAAQRHGTTESNASRIRRGATWQDLSSPFAGLVVAGGGGS